MLSKSQVKLVRSLQQKKFRDEYGYFVAEGDKCIEELKKAFEMVLYVNQDNATSSEIEQMSSLKTPQGSIAVFRQVRGERLEATGDRRQVTGDRLQATGEIILALDGVQDPGNMGTIIRTADWFGVRDIVCSRDTADCYNPKVVQATMGALARVRVHYTDLPTWLSGLEHQHEGEGVEVYGTLLEGEDMYDLVESGKLKVESSGNGAIIVMGNEGKGISEEVRKWITCPIRIPSYPKDAETSESLNVAIATAIVLAEFRRPKGEK